MLNPPTYGIQLIKQNSAILEVIVNYVKASHMQHVRVTGINDIKGSEKPITFVRVPIQLYINLYTHEYTVTRHLLFNIP